MINKDLNRFLGYAPLCFGGEGLFYLKNTLLWV
jgi:hypothetical protein